MSISVCPPGVGAASVTLLSDINQLPEDETRPFCSRVHSRLAAASRTINSDRSRNGATAANTELSLDITKYLSYSSQVRSPTSPNTSATALRYGLRHQMPCYSLYVQP